MKKIILVDDHHIVRQGLEFLLSTVEDIEVVQGLLKVNCFRLP